MGKKRRQRGFSLTEVLLAVGTLAIAMIFISGTFLAGIYFSTVATERTIAAVVADEAFAKIRLFGVDPADSNLAADRMTPFELISPIVVAEFAYPSTRTSTEKQYYWSALCRLADSDPTSRLVQVTVFVSRKVGSRTTYPNAATRPVPVQVAVSSTAAAGYERTLTVDTSGEEVYFRDGCTIVHNRTGGIYRVLQVGVETRAGDILLDEDWQGGLTDSVWLVAPPVGGGRDPCIAVYQRLIRF